MATSLLNNIIDRYLSNILEINKEETKMSLWSGTLEMNNLKFKREIFNTINLPYLELVNGYIGKMKVTLSLPRFYLYPMQLEISDVFFHAKQKSITNLNRDAEIKLIESFKNSKLKSKEEFMSDLNQLTNESPNIFNQILHNLTVIIKNVVFRFEDKVSFPNHPYSFGIVLFKAYIESVNELFSDSKVNKYYDSHQLQISNKIISVNSLSIYLDSKQANEDIGFESLIDPSERDAVEKKHGEYLSDLIDFYSYGCSEINIHSQMMSSHQYILYQLSLELKLSINNSACRKENQPKICCDITIPHIQSFISIIQIQTVMRVVAYIHLKTLYQLGICKEYYTKELNDKDKEKYIKTYREYYPCKYIQGYINENEANELLIQLSSIEDGIRYEIIKRMRSIAMKEVNHIKSLEEINKQVETIEGKWFISSSYRESELKRLNEIKAMVIEKEHQRKLLENESSEENLSNSNSNQDYTLYNISFTLKQFDICFKEDSIKKIALFTLSNFNIELKLMKLSNRLFLSLESLSLHQFIQVDDTYKEIISTNINKDGKVIQIIYEYNPKYAKSSHKLEISNQRRLDIALSYYTLMYIYKSINVGLKETIYFSELNAYAQEEVGKYIKEGYVDGLLLGNYGYFNIDIDVQLISPMIELPISSNRPCAKMSFGLINFHSNLSEENQEYDQYIGEMNSIQVVIGNEDNDDNNHLKPIFSLSVTIRTLKYKKTTAEKDYIIIDINLPSLRVILSEKQIIHILSLIERVKRDNVILNKQFPNEEMINEYYNNQNLIKQYIKENEQTESTCLSEEKENFSKEKKLLTNEEIRNENVIKCQYNIGVFELEIMRAIEDKTIINNECLSQQFIKLTLSGICTDMKMKCLNEIQFDFHLKAIEIVHNNNNLIKKEITLLMTQSQSVDPNDDFFLVIHFAQSDLTSIDITMNQMIFQCYYSTLCILFKFIMFYYQLYILIQITIDNETGIDNLDEDYKEFILLKKQSKTENEINKNFIEKLKQMMANESQKQSPSSKKKKSKYTQASITTSVGQTNQPTNSNYFNTKLQISFCLKSINISFYYNNYMLFQLKSKLTLSHSNDHIIEIISSAMTNKTIQYNYQRKNDKTNIDFMVNDFSIHNCNHPNMSHSLNSSITNYALTFNQMSYLNITTNNQITKTEIGDSPLIIIMDNKQIQTMIEFLNLLSAMKTDFNNEYIPAFSFKDIKSFNPKPSLSLSSLILDHQNRSVFQLKIHALKDRIQYEQMYNIAHFALFNDISLVLKPMSVKLINRNFQFNNTILIVVLKEIVFKYIHNSDPSDGTNLANFLLEIITGKDFAINIYNVRQLYHYFFSTIEFEINCYNREIKAWESLIESFKFECKGIQIGKSTKKRLQITSDNMFNVILSLNALKVINGLIATHNQLKAQSLIKNQYSKTNEGISESAKNDYRITITNSIGLEVKCWFGLFPKEKYTVGSKEQMSISKNILNSNITKDNDTDNKLDEIKRKMLLKQNDIFYFSICDSKPISFELTPTYNGYYKFKINTNLKQNEYNIVLKAKTSDDNNLYTISFESIITFCNKTNIEDLVITNAEGSLHLPLSINKNQSIPISKINDDKTSYYLSKQSNKTIKKELYAKLIEITDNDSKEKAKIISLDNYTYVSIAIRKLNTSNIIHVSCNNEDDDNNQQTSSVFFYEIEIKPAVIILNKTPFPITLCALSSKSMKVIDKCDRFKCYMINPLDSNNNFGLIIEINQQKYKSDSLTISKSLSSILLSNSNKKQIECKVSIIKHNETKTNDTEYDANQVQVVDYQSLSILMTFYFQYFYINRTNISLIFKSPTQAEEHQLKPNSINPICIKDKSILIKSDLSDWSDQIDISAIGTKGEIKLAQPKGNIFKKAPLIHPSSLGLMILMDNHYPNSTFVIFDKRYIIVNQLKNIIIDYKQSDTSSHYELKSNEEKELMYCNDTRMYQIRINNKDNDKDVSSWSSIFNVDSIESFDLKLMCNNKTILNKFPLENIFSYDDNKTQFVLIRVIVKFQNESTTYIIISFPQFPIKQIHNTASLPITITETDPDNKTLGIIKVNSGSKLPFVSFIGNISMHKVSNLQCSIGNKTIPFSYNQLCKKMVNQYNFIVFVDNNSVQTLRIEELSNNFSKGNKDKLINQMFNKCQGTKLKIRIKGLGISILNNEPKEMFYISFYGIDCLFNSNTTIFSGDNKIKSFESLIVYFKNIQIDEIHNDNLALPILCPKQQIIPQNEDSLLINSSNEVIVPFIQLLINKETITISNENESIRKYRQIDIAIKEFDIVIEQSTIDAYLSFHQAYANLIQNIEETNIDNNTILPEEDIAITTTPPLSCYQIDNRSNQTSMAIIDYLLLSAIKFNLTLRIDVTRIDFAHLPHFILTIIGIFGKLLTKINNLPLRYNEFIYEAIFIERDKILFLLQQYYVKSTLKQIYKVLGYNDLIGNPLQLIDNIGTGFFELVNEPRKGFIQGTVQFEKGLEKGMHSFVSNVIGGSFASISNISGTLLAASKKLQGERIENEGNKPKNIKEGAIRGLKEGFNQLSDGLSGLITNPYTSAKQEGALGFFKGVGEGLTKAVFCPLTSALAVTTNITQGISNTFTNSDNNINKPKQHFRVIRKLKPKEPIQPYNYPSNSSKPFFIEETSSSPFESDDSSENIKLLFKLPKDTVLLLNLEYHIMTKGSEGKIGRIIITNEIISAITKESGQLIFKAKISKLCSCQMQFTNSIYTLIFLKKNFKIKKIALAESIIANRIKETIKGLITYSTK